MPHFRLTAIGLAALAAIFLFTSPSQAGWREDLSAMPLVANPGVLDETNCVPLMLQSFHAGKSARALIFMPGATDELYFFHRVRARLEDAHPTLADAVAALTNQTPIRAAWSEPFLILHTEEDPLDTIGIVEDASAAERIKARRVAAEARFDDRDWAVLQPFLVKALKFEVGPGPDSPPSHHFYRHSFAVGDLSGWELLRAVAMAGKTKFRVGRDRVFFEADHRVMAIPSTPTNFLASIQEPPSMKRIGSIPLDDVKGRLDHLTVDLKTGRLFVAALGNHSVEVIDIAARRRIRQLTGLNEPQGLVFVPGANRLLVCSRGDGSVRSFDAQSFEEGPRLDLGRNADNIRLANGLAVVGSGGEPGQGRLSGIDVASLAAPSSTGRKPFIAQVQLPAHPESFQFDSSKHQFFVNLPETHQVGVVDGATTNWKISALWSIADAASNFPMAWDTGNRRLFVGCREPARMLAYDTGAGRLLFQAACIGDADDLFYDATLKRVYVIGGEGAIDIFAVPDNATEALPVARIPTAPKARTGLFIPEVQIMAIAAPAVDNTPAQILLYRPGE